MKVVNLSEIVCDAIEEMKRETPDPFRHNNLFFDDRSTYRERLDRQPRNWYGELIPRIVTVRHNLRRFKSGY